jgi:hypothetical protein
MLVGTGHFPETKVAERYRANAPRPSSRVRQFFSSILCSAA